MAEMERLIDSRELKTVISDSSVLDVLRACRPFPGSLDFEISGTQQSYAAIGTESVRQPYTELGRYDASQRLDSWCRKAKHAPGGGEASRFIIQVNHG
jgi:hypothetical protein